MKFLIFIFLMIFQVGFMFADELNTQTVSMGEKATFRDGTIVELNKVRRFKHPEKEFSTLYEYLFTIKTKSETVKGSFSLFYDQKMKSLIYRMKNSKNGKRVASYFELNKKNGDEYGVMTVRFESK